VLQPLQLAGHHIGGVPVQAGEGVGLQPALQLAQQRQRPFQRVRLEPGGEPAGQRHGPCHPPFKGGGRQRPLHLRRADAFGEAAQRGGTLVRGVPQARLGAVQVPVELLLGTPGEPGRRRQHRRHLVVALAFQVVARPHHAARRGRH
jgi:hypothetical protein